jgi:bifunctional DNA-binding transcriptional regulator/antitoxin component of YhaV-PrlF toxin-antitoxin module
MGEERRERRGAMARAVQRVDALGQITIADEARRELGVEPGMIAHQRVVDGRLEVVFLPAPHTRSLFGVFRDPARAARVTTAEELEAAVAEAIAAEEADRETGRD